MTFDFCDVTISLLKINHSLSEDLVVLDFCFVLVFMKSAFLIIEITFFGELQTSNTSKGVCPVDPLPNLSLSSSCMKECGFK